MADTGSRTSPIPAEWAEFRSNKQIPAVIEKNVLHALSFYPELQNTPIHFKFRKNIKSSVMQAQPVFSSILRSRGKRAYQINISSLFKLVHAAVPIHQIPDNIMVGWIGHELGHVMDYESRSNLDMIRFGLSYLLSSRFIRKAEQVADTHAVNHGLGEYIIATKRFILEHAELPQAYKDKIARLYLSPDAIVEQVKKLEERKLQLQKHTDRRTDKL
ncbi:hypothetical protein [Arcticibacter sp. MXS-1]|uniref:hypothetical protein n=1 Tax=Arcticibacter sp. MXS-1 TaxID=3341726 RepID=UPI0035A8BD33